MILLGVRTFMKDEGERTIIKAWFVAYSQFEDAATSRGRLGS